MKDKIQSILIIVICLGIGWFFCGGRNVIFNSVEGDNIKLSGYKTDLKIDNDVGKYYYNELTDISYADYAQIFYNELYKNKENLKSGNYTIDFGYIFTEKLNEVSLMDDISHGDEHLIISSRYALIAFQLENPDMFYIDISKIRLHMDPESSILSSKPKYHVYMDCGSNSNYFIEGVSSKADVEKMEKEIQDNVKTVLEQAKVLSDDYSKIKFIHDYLVDTIDYDETLSEKYIHNMYGALVNKKCVCDGYANSFQYFMNQLNIDSMNITGYTINHNNVYHQWNYVKLNGDWYMVDVTWDDPTTKTEEKTYKYFLKGNSSSRLQDHFQSWRLYQENHDLSKTYEVSSMSSSLSGLSAEHREKISNGDIDIYLDVPKLSENDYNL